MVKFGETQGEIIDEEGEVVAMALKTGSLYYLRCEPMINERINSATDQAGENLWHRRYGHLGEKNLSVEERWVSQWLRLRHIEGN